jgi:hypothetical protein
MIWPVTGKRSSAFRVENEIKLYIEDAVEYGFLSTILPNVLIFEFAL